MADLKKKSIWEAYRFSIILLGAIFLGSLIGIQFGEKAKILKPLGDLFINGMFTIVVPLVLVTISSSISSMSDMKRLKSVLIIYKACENTLDSIYVENVRLW